MKIAIANIKLAIRALEAERGIYASYGYTIQLTRVIDELEEQMTRLPGDTPVHGLRLVEKESG